MSHKGSRNEGYASHPGIQAADKPDSQQTGQKTSKQHALHNNACIPVVKKNIFFLVKKNIF